MSQPDPTADPATDPPPRSRLRPLEASLLTFIAAACVLVLEIAAARLLAPYVGVSLTTTTSIIGVILAGIAAGAWAGGRAADRVRAGPAARPAVHRRWRGRHRRRAGHRPRWVRRSRAPGRTRASCCSLVAFVLPAALLSAVAPVIVRATLRDVEGSGTVVGRLSAVGTAGALTGTFLTGYLLLGLVPVRALIVGTGVVLVLLGPGRDGPAPAPAGGRDRGARDGRGDPGRAVARRWARRASARAPTTASRCGPRRPTRRCGRWSWTTCSTPASTSTTRRRSRSPTSGGSPARPPTWARPRTGRSTSSTSAAAGSRSRATCWRRAPWSRHAVLELDPVILATAREELGLADDPRIDVRLGDARRTIEGIADDSRDLVVGDAFASRSVPWHLATTEFLDELDRVLRPGRPVRAQPDRRAAARVRPRRGGDAARARSSMSRWSRGAPRSTGTAAATSCWSPPTSRWTSTASARGGGPASPRRHACSRIPAELDAFVAGAPVLTDDFAPTDQLLGG